MKNYSNILEKLNFNILMGNLNINVVNLNKVDPDPHWYVPEHVHTDFEFHIVPSGKGYITIDENDFEINAGEFYITGPMVKHSQLSDTRSPMTEYCLECEINIVESELVDSPFVQEEYIFLKETLSNTYPRTFKDSYGIASTFEEIFLEAEQQKPGFLLKIQTLTYKIVADVLRVICILIWSDRAASTDLCKLWNRYYNIL